MEFPKAMLGVSIDNKEYWDVCTFENCCRAIQAESRSWSIMIGDYLNRHNHLFRKRHKLSSRHYDNRFEDFINRVISPSEFSQARLIRWREIYNSDSMIFWINKFTEFYQSNPQFRSLLDNDINMFISRNSIVKELREECSNVSRTYIIEELAGFSVVAANGCEQLAYLGDFLPSTKYFKEDGAPLTPLASLKLLNLKI